MPAGFLPLGLDLEMGNSQVFNLETLSEIFHGAKIIDEINRSGRKTGKFVIVGFDYGFEVGHPVYSVVIFDDEDNRNELVYKNIESEQEADILADYVYHSRSHHAMQLRHPYRDSLREKYAVRSDRA
jgi:hypothetical protein